MNKVVLLGRLTRDPEIRISGETTVVRYTLAVNRRFRRDNDPEADFINCVAFGKNGEFAEKYLHQGTKIAVSGRIQTGSYEKDGVKHYITDVIVEEHDFAGNKTEQPQNNVTTTDSNGFMSIPDNVSDEGLPF